MNQKQFFVMKKVADIDIYGFIALYQVLKEKFQDPYLVQFETRGFAPHQIRIWKESNDLYVTIKNPDLDSLKSLDLDSKIDLIDMVIVFENFGYIVIETTRQNWDNWNFIDEIKKVLDLSFEEKAGNADDRLSVKNYQKQQEFFYELEDMLKESSFFKRGEKIKQSETY